jgi:hypothetical protein
MIPLIRWARNKGAGRSLTTAPSASLDEIDASSQTITMKRASDQFAEVMHRYFPNVLPFATTLDKDLKLGLEIGEITKLKSTADVHNMMAGIAQAYQNLVGEPWRVVYQDQPTTSL